MPASIVGRRIAVLRRQRGWTQQQLGDRLDYSVDWVRSIEQGRRRLEQWSVIERVASVLGVNSFDLIGQSPAGKTSNLPEAHLTIPGVRRALTMPPWYQTRGTMQLRSAKALQAENCRLTKTRETGHLATFGVQMPSALAELESALANPLNNSDELREAYIELLHSVNILAYKLGYADLAWIACEKARAQSEYLGKPTLIAATHWNYIELYLKKGATSEAKVTTHLALDAIEPELGNDSKDVWALWGTLHEMGAMIAAKAGDYPTMREHIGEARRVTYLTGEHNAHQTLFGLGNMTIWHMSCALELRRADETLRLATDMPLRALPNNAKRSRFLVNKARALEGLGRVSDASEAFLESARLAPEEVKNNPVARALVRSLLTRQRRASRIGELARKMAITIDDPPISESHGGAGVNPIHPDI